MSKRAGDTRCRAPIASSVGARGRAMPVTKPRENPAQSLHWPSKGGEHALGSCELFSSDLLSGFGRRQLLCMKTRGNSGNEVRADSGGSRVAAATGAWRVGLVLAWAQPSRRQGSANGTHRDTGTGGLLRGQRVQDPETEGIAPCLEPPASLRTFHGQRPGGAGKSPSLGSRVRGSSLVTTTNCPSKAHMGIRILDVNAQLRDCHWSSPRQS